MKIWKIPQKVLRLLNVASLVFVLALFYGIVIATQQQSQEVFVPNNDKLPIYCVSIKDKKVAVTFDAAWGSDSTEQILNILDEYQAKCTFFLVSYWVDKNESLVQEIVARGHEIGSHSSTHPHMSGMARDTILQEINDNADKIKTLTNQQVTLFRPPYGDYDANLIATVKQAGYQTIQWDVDSLDWKKLDASAILNRVKSKVGPGSIILFHNNSKYIVDSLKATLEYLKGQGYEMVKVSELIYPEPYTLDHEGRQHAASTLP